MSELGMHRFADRTRNVLNTANKEAHVFNQACIDTEHILLGLVKEGGGTAIATLASLGIDLREIRLQIQRLAPVEPEMGLPGKLPLTERAKKVMELADDEARTLNHNYVGTEHLLLDLLREQEGLAARVLTSLGLTPVSVRKEVLDLLRRGQEGIA